MKKLIILITLVFLLGCENREVKKTKYKEINKITTRKPLSKEKEMRGVWIATLVNINWPRTKGIGQEVIEKQKKEYRDILDEVVEMDMNSVFVQVRPTADAFYPSSFEPWSKYLTGEQGKFPGWDPLKFMVEEAHKRGLAFHAWFNPYRITLKETDQLSKNHPASIHPEWIFEYGGKKYYNPGIPEARKYCINTIMEVVDRYDIDGVHMDDYFYPYPRKDEGLPDWETYLKYGKENFDIAADWRRNNVDLFIKELSERIKKSKKDIQFGISPFGVWRNKRKDPTGSATRAGVTNYDDLYANTRKWIKKGWIDYIAPQIYWYQGLSVADYNTLVDWWGKEVKETKTKLYIGHAAYKVGSWKKEDELINQIKYNRKRGNTDGDIFYNVDSLINDPRGIRKKLKELYN